MDRSAAPLPPLPVEDPYVPEEQQNGHQSINGNHFQQPQLYDPRFIAQNSDPNIAQFSNRSIPDDGYNPPPRGSSRSQNNSPISTRYAVDEYGVQQSHKRVRRASHDPPPSIGSAASTSSNRLSNTLDYEQRKQFQQMQQPHQYSSQNSRSRSTYTQLTYSSAAGTNGTTAPSSFPDSRQFEQPTFPNDPDPFYTQSSHNAYQIQQQDSSEQPSRVPSPPLLDHSHLRPGKQASLLSHEQTLALYRSNAKKTSDPDLIYEFAVFMLEAVKNLPGAEAASINALNGPSASSNYNQIEIERAAEKQEALIREALGLLKRIADRGHVLAQYTLADCYANGLGTVRGRQDFDRAFPLFILAAKHNHVDACYRAGTCCENGWGCRRDSAKAVQFFRKAGAMQHPGAMYRLGLAELNGELGLSKNAKEGVKWLKRSAEHATSEFPHALHELALCHEKGIHNVVFVDYDYAAELLGHAAELGYAPSAYRLGECYEYGRMGCPQDPALSIHYYNIAAQQNHRDACFALTAWYLVGSPGVLPQSDTEAFLWAKRAADAGLAKAMYATGYFYESGIGTPASMPDAVIYFKKAAELGDRRAIARLKHNAHPPRQYNPGDPASGAAYLRDVNGAGGGGGGDSKGKDCIIM